MIVKIIFGLGIIIWEVFRVQMSKFTLLESPLLITGHKAGKNDTMTVGFFKVMDQPEPGVRDKVRDNALRFGYYAASATLRCGS